MRTKMVAVVAVAAIAGAGCTLQLSEAGMRWPCGPVRYEINPAGATADQLEAVHRAVGRYAEELGRDIDFAGLTDDRGADATRPTDAPILIEWYWPEGAPVDHLGHAEPFTEGHDYVGGSVYLRPLEVPMPPSIVERLVMHEMGHIGGLDDVEDPDEVMDPRLLTAEWGSGDRLGLVLTHAHCG